MGFGWVYEVGLLVWLVAVEGGWGVGVLRAVSVGVSGRYGGWRWWWYVPLVPNSL